MARVVDFIKNLQKKRSFRVLIVIGDIPNSIRSELEFIPKSHRLWIFQIRGHWAKVAITIHRKLVWLPLPFLSRVLIRKIKALQLPIVFIHFGFYHAPFSHFERYFISQFNNPHSFFIYFSNLSLPEVSISLPWQPCFTLFEGTADLTQEGDTKITVMGTFNPPEVLASSRPIRVLAIMTAYNEGDIIEHTIRALISQGIDVYLIDKWSTDDTYQKASQFLDQGLIGIEQFPSSGPSQYYHWGELLKRVDALAMSMPHDWIIHHDADEIRYGPWPEVNLRDSLQMIDSLGYTAADHCLLNFQPIDNGYSSDISPEPYFKFFEFGKSVDSPQVKAWKNQFSLVHLDQFGGHSVRFPSLKVFPFQFIIKHYRIRSDDHGRKKVFQDRKSRWDPEERSKGWHIQYDSVQLDTSFIKSPENCFLFDEQSFYTDYLVERFTWR